MKSKKINDYFWGYLMILPTVGGLTIFYIYPFFKTLFYSFTDLGTFGEYSIVGISNYIRLFSDTEVWMSLKNTLMFTIISVPISIFLSIVVATLLNSKIKGLTIYRTLYFLPAVTMPAAIAMVWKWLYNYDYGLINYILSKFGIEKIYWVSDPKIALYSIIAISVWSSVGYNMVIFLAGIQNISSTYYEAAAIDGANSINQFFKITIPLLTPTIFFVMVMSLIGAFQVFDYIFMIIGTSNPALKNTQSVVYLFYRSAFELGEKGYASAIAIMLFVIIMLITIVQLKLQKKWVNY
ncbi:MAG: sugar ABC transporter permease [Caloramator sp.]|nr:sugar ABC transporter permease [Caloramator sp.]